MFNHSSADHQRKHCDSGRKNRAKLHTGDQENKGFPGKSFDDFSGLSTFRYPRRDAKRLKDNPYHVRSYHPDKATVARVKLLKMKLLTLVSHKNSLLAARTSSTTHARTLNWETTFTAWVSTEFRNRCQQSLRHVQVWTSEGNHTANQIIFGIGQRLSAYYLVWTSLAHLYLQEKRERKRRGNFGSIFIYQSCTKT